jgi:UDP-N-acetyl-D-mannosaminuronate dehydrogenase
MKVGILGMGEVGKSLFSLYIDNGITPLKKDIKNKKEMGSLSILNICIPYNKNFIQNVVNEISKTNPELIIIHSTVPVGTTAKIKLSPNQYLVHSPVIGYHPELKKCFKIFVKHIGSPDKKALKITKKHYRKLGIKYQSYDSYESTEIAKLLCTTYYGLCITWHSYMKSVCDHNNIDFSIIKQWNKHYNEGYKKLNLSKFNRPILEAPKNKKIGGHCIITNAKMLNMDFPNNLIKEILKLT